jgi:hypothetical protein
MVHNCAAYKYLNECTEPCHCALHAAGYTPRQPRKCVNFNYYIQHTVQHFKHLLTSRFSEMNCFLIFGFILTETDTNNIFNEVCQIKFVDNEPKFC